MRLGSRAKLTIGIGVVAAAGFVALGVQELGGAGHDRATQSGGDRPPPSSPIALLAASTRAIRTGETITADMVRGASGDPARHSAAAAPVEAIGKVATRDIPANALIPRDALDTEDKLAIRVPLGMRAISIETTAEIAVAGLLHPGDRVDVQVVYPGADAISGARGAGRSQAQTLLQLVQILAVGDAVLGAQAGAAGASGSSSSAPAVARTVTLALLPDQVAALSLAKSTGALHLALRNPKDETQPRIARAMSAGPLPASPTSIVPQPLSAGLATLPARSAPAARAPVRPARAPHAIDVVMGGNHKVIYSGGDAR